MNDYIGGAAEENLARWQKCADEVGMPLWEWVGLACDMFATNYQPALRFEHDLNLVPASKQEAWSREHRNDPRYQIEAPLHL